ncbi:hypothetical protein Q7P37_004203 [Cladosporium fusiforme]
MLPACQAPPLPHLDDRLWASLCDYTQDHVDVLCLVLGLLQGTSETFMCPLPTRAANRTSVPVSDLSLLVPQNLPTVEYASEFLRHRGHPSLTLSAERRAVFISSFKHTMPALEEHPSRNPHPTEPLFYFPLRPMQPAISSQNQRRNLTSNSSSFCQVTSHAQNANTNRAIAPYPSAIVSTDSRAPWQLGGSELEEQFLYNFLAKAELTKSLPLRLMLSCVSGSLHMARIGKWDSFVWHHHPSY